MVEFVEHYLSDERLQMALLGQGVIGTNASPLDPGTASIHFHHASGRLGGMPGMWGYVKGGMGMVSFLLCDAAREAGAVVAAGVPVARIVPGQGVELEAGERIDAPVVVVERRPAGRAAPAGQLGRPGLAGAGRGDSDDRLHGQAQRRPPRAARLQGPAGDAPGASPRADQHAAHEGRVAKPPSRPRAPAGSPTGSGPSSTSRSAHDRSVAPEGVETMSVFAQYVPHTFATGDWESRRQEVDRPGPRPRSPASAATSPTRCSKVETLGPPDIERTGRPDRRAHLPGRVPARLHVEQPPRLPYPDARRLPLRRLHPPRRQRHRRQRPQRGDGGPRCAAS